MRNRLVDTIADAIGSVVLGNLHDPTEAERAQSRIIKGGGTGDICYTDARIPNTDSAEAR